MRIEVCQKKKNPERYIFHVAFFLKKKMVLKLLSKAAVLNPKIETSTGVVCQIFCIPDISIMIHNSCKVQLQRSNRIILWWEGHHHMTNCIRKVENH